MLLEVIGAGFRLGASTGVGAASPLHDTVRVQVGERAATEVRVSSAERLTCIVPAGHVGAADVRLQNLGDDGQPIPGEEAVALSALQYARPSLAVEADLTRLVRTVLQQLKRDVVDAVVLTVHTDYDDASGTELHLANLAALPGLVLIGPELAEDRFYSINERPEVEAADGRIARRRVPYTVDLSFSIVGVASHSAELLNLAASTQLFFHRNQHLEMARDAADPDAGTVRYDLDVPRDGAVRVTGSPNESNVRSFSGRFLIRGFDLEALAGFSADGVTDLGTRAADVSIQPPLPLSGQPTAIDEP